MVNHWKKNFSGNIWINHFKLKLMNCLLKEKRRFSRLLYSINYFKQSHRGNFVKYSHSSFFFDQFFSYLLEITFRLFIGIPTKCQSLNILVINFTHAFVKYKYLTCPFSLHIWKFCCLCEDNHKGGYFVKWWKVLYTYTRTKCDYWRINEKTKVNHCKFWQKSISFLFNYLKNIDI